MNVFRFAAPVLALGLLAGCAAHKNEGQAAAATVPPRPVAPAPRPLQPPMPAAQMAALHVDESGRIPIFMYHSIGAPAHRGTQYDKEGLNISPDTFRKQLALMYAANWYPMNMRDILTARLDVPAGKTPVVLTFDDARGSQFHYLKDGTVDPNCAVGILQAFHKTHPDWPLKATFYVLPKSAWNPAPFWQPGTETKKLRALVADGFEIGNHTTTHRMMGRLPATELIWETAGCERYVDSHVPGWKMDTMALPGGDYPKNKALWADLRSGKLGDVTYSNRCLLMAWGDPSRNWVDKKFNADRIPRIGVSPGWAERRIKDLRTGLIPEYVSDGNPDTVAMPRSEVQYINPKRLEGARLVAYGPAPKKAPSG